MILLHAHDSSTSPNGSSCRPANARQGRVAPGGLDSLLPLREAKERRIHFLNDAWHTCVMLPLPPLIPEHGYARVEAITALVWVSALVVSLCALAVKMTINTFRR